MTHWPKEALRIMAHDRKMQLVVALNHALRHDTQVVAARRLSTTQSRVSQLRNLDPSNISLDRLLSWTLRVGYDVEIRVTRRRT